MQEIPLNLTFINFDQKNLIAFNFKKEIPQKNESDQKKVSKKLKSPSFYEIPVKKFRLHFYKRHPYQI